MPQPCYKLAAFATGRIVMSVDYEAEYNNRARVPEHPEIFARWDRDAAAYRAEATAAALAELGTPYGPTARQTIDLFRPREGAAAPLTLFIHGGYWRSLDPSSFSHMARGLNALGIAVAIAGYDLCPTVRIADIIDEMRQACLYLWRRFGRRIVVHGHSAGGHLAACLLATDWKKVAADAPADLVPAAVAISGLFDLTPLVRVSMNQDLRLTDADARAVSPVFWPAPRGLTIEAWCGELESSEFRRQNRLIADVWGKNGVHAVAREIAGANHFTALDPLAEPESELVQCIAALAKRT